MTSSRDASTASTSGTKIENLTVNNYPANYEGKVKYPAATLNPIHRFKNFVNRTAGELNQ